MWCYDYVSKYKGNACHMQKIIFDHRYYILNSCISQYNFGLALSDKFKEKVYQPKSKGVRKNIL